MKYKHTLILLLLLTMVFNSVTAQTKHALIFAIGNYPEDKGWANLSSLRDAEVINKTLSNQKFDDIRIYLDTQVTHRGIANAFRGLINDKNLHKGDIVVIHFSTHGSQVEDDNGDEVDRLDESIVTFAALAPLNADKKDFQKNQREYFRDDEFGDYINQLRDTLGKEGDIIVFIDACHSGSGTRGNAKVRGGQPPLVSENFDSTMLATVDLKGKSVFREKNAVKDDEKGLATYVVFSAARADELDHEAKNKGLGSLSYAISKVFENLDAGTTYRSLFTMIQSVMNEVAPNQHPVLEGNGIDRKLFGGEFVWQKPYIEIEKIFKGNPNLILVKAGLLSGLDIGAKVVVCPPDTKDPSKSLSLASGIVTKATNYTANIKLDKNLNNLNPTSAWVFVTEPVYNTKPVNIGFSATISRGAIPGFSETEIKGIKERFKDLPGFRFDGDSEIVIVKGEIKDFISIKIASNGYIFKTIRDIGSVGDTLIEELKRYTQYKFLRDVEINDPDAQVEIKLVPFIKEKADTSKIDSKIVHEIYEIYEFIEGDKFVVWIKNKGTYPVYVNILDLQPDGIINPIFPNKKATDSKGNLKPIYPSDLLLDAGASRIFSDFPITLFPPFGMEIFKIFVSRKPIDMEGISDSRGATSRGNFTVLAKLVKDSYTMASRGYNSESLSNTDGSTFNVLFRIKAKK